MRVRLRQHPLGGTWYVETKRWWYLEWHRVEDFCGDNALERATQYAERLIRPNVVEVK
jgi:hypothetical protein